MDLAWKIDFYPLFIDAIVVIVTLIGIHYYHRESQGDIGLNWLMQNCLGFTVHLP